MLYWETFDVLESLVDGEAKQMLTAIRRYSQYGALPDFSDSAMLSTLWLLIRPKLDTDAERYENIRNSRVEAGRKGGLARASNAKQIQATEANATFAKQIKPTTTTSTTTTATTSTTSTSYNKGNSSELPGEKKATRFVPPTVEEVRAYCQERHNGVNPETFVDFYTGKGWFVGKNKMKDWKAAVRTWEQSRNGQTQTQKINRDDYDNGDQEPW